MEKLNWISTLIIVLAAILVGYWIGAAASDNQTCTINPTPIKQTIELITDCPPVECICDSKGEKDLAYCLSYIRQAKKFEKDLKEIR